MSLTVSHSFPLENNTQSKKIGGFLIRFDARDIYLSDKARGSFCTPRAAGVNGAEERDDDGKEKFKRAIIVVQLGSTVESIGQTDLSDVVATVT